MFLKITFWLTLIGIISYFLILVHPIFIVSFIFCIIALVIGVLYVMFRGAYPGN